MKIILDKAIPMPYIISMNNNKGAKTVTVIININNIKVTINAERTFDGKYQVSNCTNWELIYDLRDAGYLEMNLYRAGMGHCDFYLTQKSIALN